MPRPDEYVRSVAEPVIFLGADDMMPLARSPGPNERALLEPRRFTPGGAFFARTFREHWAISRLAR